MLAQPPLTQEVPLKVVGSNLFGRYPKISIEETFNMFMSDGFLVDYAGHAKAVTIETVGSSRGIFNSIPLGKLIVVVDNSVYTIDKQLNFEFVANIDTYTGDVFMAENNAKQIAISDRKNIYGYDYGSDSFAKAVTDFVPGYVTFQNGSFLASNVEKAEWRLSALNNVLSWPASAGYVGEFETKADLVQAVIPIPGKGNHVLVMGSIGTESWEDVSNLASFPYDRSSAFNIDYGCANPSTIAFGDKFIVWVGINEKSGPVIMYSEGGDPQPISQDGIDFKLAHLEHPESSFGSLYKQDGHLFYHATFLLDNITYIYDFTDHAFYTLTDEYMDHHIAKKIVFFNNKYYFISFNDGILYELNSTYTEYDGAEIPRVRMLSNFKLPNSFPFIVEFLTFIIEQGINETDSRIDISISRDGGESFSSYHGMEMQSLGNRKNIADIWSLGLVNELAIQFRFWGHGRFVVSNGVMGIRQ